MKADNLLNFKIHVPPKPGLCHYLRHTLSDSSLLLTLNIFHTLL